MQVKLDNLQARIRLAFLVLHLLEYQVELYHTSKNKIIKKHTSLSKKKYTKFFIKK